MKTGRLLLVLLLWLSAPALAQPAPATVRVVLHTAAGDVIVAVETERAPISARNFLRYVDQRRLDGASFYRAMNVGPTDGLIQGGWRTNPRRMLPPIVHEPTSRTGLSHTDGAVAFARGAPGTAQSEFYIVAGNLTALDASGIDPGYAVFGRVVEGMDVVRRILASPKSPTEGEGVMRGQFLARPVRILTARRIP